MQIYAQAESNMQGFKELLDLSQGHRKRVSVQSPIMQMQQTRSWLSYMQTSHLTALRPTLYTRGCLALARASHILLKLLNSAFIEALLLVSKSDIYEYVAAVFRLLLYYHREIREAKFMNLITISDVKFGIIGSIFRN